MEHKVVITGFGCVTAAGDNVEDTWQAVNAGKSAIDTISQWDVSAWDYQLAAEIKNYDARRMVADRKLLKLISKQDVLGLYAAQQALQHSELLEYRNSLPDPTAFNDRTGLVVASPGNKYQQQYDFMPLFARAKNNVQEFAAGLFETVHPMWLLKILPNNVLAYVGIQYGFKGPNENITNHGVGGLQAITEAYHLLKRGAVDRAIVVAYDEAIEPQAQVYYSALGVLSKTGLFPFDARHSGTILGEGSGALVLETLAAAKERGATIYGEILSGATTCEAKGVFAIDEQGDGLRRVINKGLSTAGLSPNDMGMIVTHGNGNPQSDMTEAKTISEIFGDRALPATGFKSIIGHTMAAAGVIETILLLLALRENTVPGMTNFNLLAEECAKLNVSATPRPPRSSLGLIVSRGFGSLNSALLVNADVTSC